MGEREKAKTWGEKRRTQRKPEKREELGRTGRVDSFQGVLVGSTDLAVLPPVITGLRTTD